MNALNALVIGGSYGGGMLVSVECPAFVTAGSLPIPCEAEIEVEQTRGGSFVFLVPECPCCGVRFDENASVRVAIICAANDAIANYAGPNDSPDQRPA